MANVAELSKLLETTGLLTTAEDLRVPVTVKDARISYGQVNVYVVPVGGIGGAWVSAARYKVQEVGR
jgi:hypothetical protein